MEKEELKQMLKEHIIIEFRFDYLYGDKILGVEIKFDNETIDYEYILVEELSK